MNTLDRSMPRLALPTDTTGVVTCYDTLSLAEQIGGIFDFTEGIYSHEDGDDWKGYLAAQWRQADYLLNQANCGIGSIILDIGCGYGRILKQAEERGAVALGITLSKPQWEKNHKVGLRTLLMNYRAIPDGWANRFTGIIANGSLEHFVQPEDAWNGHADDLYREMFGICQKILRPGGCFVTTAIHFRGSTAPDPKEIMNGKYRRGSREWQLRSLFKNFPGWWPSCGQLSRCAKGLFRLIDQENGTEDYRRTSEFWLRELKWKLATSPRVWAVVAKAYLRRDAVWNMLVCQFWDQAWAWQFRRGPKGELSPMVLLRQTWQRED